MPYQLLHDLLPEIAENETRTISVIKDRSEDGLPPGTYAFHEMYCNERGCDCRRVFFYVVASFRRGPEAVICWGWESPEFYAKWLHSKDPQMLRELIGPSLNLGSPQSELAPALLRLAWEVLLQDVDYVERMKRHYALFRAKIDGRSPVLSPGKPRRRRRKR